MKFDITKTVSYWLDGAEYDLGVAQALYEKGKYPYALFMGHLALEKLLKALVVKSTHSHAPFTHSLSLLANRLNIEIPDKMRKRLVRFTEFQIEPRYPEEEKKFYKKCTQKFTLRQLQEIKEDYIWLREKFEIK